LSGRFCTIDFEGDSKARRHQIWRRIEGAITSTLKATRHQSLKGGAPRRPRPQQATKAAATLSCVSFQTEQPAYFFRIHTKTTNHVIAVIRDCPDHQAPGLHPLANRPISDILDIVVKPIELVVFEFRDEAPLEVFAELRAQRKSLGRQSKNLRNASARSIAYGFIYGLHKVLSMVEG
jgi:hypothetical protein